jgi:hypothetical protein
MTTNTRTIRSRDEETVDCRHLHSATPRHSITAADAAVAIVFNNVGWEKCAHLVDTQALYPDLAGSCERCVE